MSYIIIVGDRFGKERRKLSKRYGSLKDDLIQLREELLENPLIGSLLCKDCHKVRMAIASKNKGK
jgi:hypothetical protein